MVEPIGRNLILLFVPPESLVAPNVSEDRRCPDHHFGRLGRDDVVLDDHRHDHRGRHHSVLGPLAQIHVQRIPRQPLNTDSQWGLRRGVLSSFQDREDRDPHLVPSTAYEQIRASAHLEPGTDARLRHQVRVASCRPHSGLVGSHREPKIRGARR